jgi:hypothetical protein
MRAQVDNREDAEIRRSLRLRALHRGERSLLAVFVLIVVLEHFLEPGLSPLRHQISEYANTRADWLIEIGFVSWALSLGLTSAYVDLHLERSALRLTLSLALGLAALGLLLTAAFHTQTSAGVLPRGVHLSASGRLHDWGSGITTLALAIGALSCVRLPGLSRRRQWSSGVLVAAALIANLALLAAGSSVGGLRQRILIAIGCLWQTLLVGDE